MAIPIRFTFDIYFDPKCIPIPVDLDYGLKLIWKKDPTVSGPDTDSSVWYILNATGGGKMAGDGGSAKLYVDTSKSSVSGDTTRWVYVLEITPDTIPPSTVNTEFLLSYDASFGTRTLTTISPPENDFLVDIDGIANFILPAPVIKKSVCIRYVLQAFDDLHFPAGTVKFFLTTQRTGSTIPSIEPGSVKLSWVKKISEGNFVPCFMTDSISTENEPDGTLYGNEGVGEICYTGPHINGSITLNYDPGLYDKNMSLLLKMDYKIVKYSSFTDTISGPKLDSDGFITIHLTKKDIQEKSTISISMQNLLVADMYGVLKDSADKETCLTKTSFGFFGAVGDYFNFDGKQGYEGFDTSLVTLDRENGILKFKILGLRAIGTCSVPKTAIKVTESVPVADVNGNISIKNIEKYKYTYEPYYKPYIILSEKTKIIVTYSARDVSIPYIAEDAVGYGVNWISEYTYGANNLSFNQAYKEQLVYDDGNGGWEIRFADKTTRPVTGTINYETGVCQFDTNVENAFFVSPTAGSTSLLQNGRGRNVQPSVLGSTLYPPLPRVIYSQRSKYNKNFTLKAVEIPLPEKSAGAGVTPSSTTVVAGNTVIKDDAGTLKSTDPVTGAQTSVGTVTAKPAPVVSDAGVAVPVTPTATMTQWPQIDNSTASVSAAAPVNKEEETGASSPRLLFRTASAPLVPGSLSFTVDFAREYKKITPTDVVCPKVAVTNGVCVLAGYTSNLFTETDTLAPLVVVITKKTTVITATTVTKPVTGGGSVQVEAREKSVSVVEMTLPDVEITVIKSNSGYFSTNLPDSNPPPSGPLPPVGTYIEYASAALINAPVGTDEPVSISVTAQSNGQLTGTAVLDPAAYPYNLHVYGSVDYVTGVVDAIFGVWMTREDAAGYAWYSEDMPEDVDGKVFYAHPVVMGSVKYNAVAYSDVPIDAAMLGIDAARLPSDGRVPVFYDGQMVLVHHTGTHAETTLSASQAVDMGRTRLYRVAIDDSTGKRLPADFYSVNRATGVVTMASDLSLTGYSGPYTFRHTIADLARVIDADLSGALSLNKPITHAYPANESSVSGALYAGTLQARVSRVFSQQTWTSVWSDTRIGDAPLAQYNNTQWPISVSNRDAAPDRYLIQFTSSSAFRLIGEQQGIIDTGNINEDFSPINTLTGRPIMTIDYRGWGLGWSTGNVLRFNVTGASVPIALTRAVMPSEPTGTDDSVELLLIGNIDA